MRTVRLNITLPEELAQALEKLVSPRQKSRFIAEAISQRIKKIQNEELERTLEEGYRARKDESISIAKEFESIDIEGWDEY